MTKKQFIFPIAILMGVILFYFVAASFEKPPEEKKKVDNTPIVDVFINEFVEQKLIVTSYGIASAKFETTIAAQVSGEIVYISKDLERGGFVKKGTILARIDKSDYQADLIEAEAGVTSANASLIKEKALAKVAKQQRRSVSSLASPLSLHVPQLTQAKAVLLSAKAKYQRAKRNLSKTVIRAPFNGLIKTRSIGLGSYVRVGEKLAEVLSTNIAEIRLPIVEDDFQYLQNDGVGLNVLLTSHVAGKTVFWKGKIVRSEGVLDAKSRMNYLVAEVKDPYGRLSKAVEHIDLRYGTYLTVKIEGETAKEISVIDESLLVDGKVAIVTDKNTIHFQEVEALRVVGQKAYIRTGLKKGAKVISSALNYPIEGLKVKIGTTHVGSEK